MTFLYREREREEIERERREREEIERKEIERGRETEHKEREEDLHLDQLALSYLYGLPNSKMQIVRPNSFITSMFIF